MQAQEDTECLEPQSPQPLHARPLEPRRVMYVVHARGGKESELVPSVVISQADVFDARGAMFTNIDRD